MPLWLLPKIQFTLVAAALHCWLVFSSLSTRTPKSLSVRLLPSCTDPGLYCYIVPGAGLCICLLDLILFLLVCSSSLSPCEMALLSNKSLATLVRVLLIPSSRSFMNILNSVGPGIDPWGTTCDRLPASVKTIDRCPLTVTCEPMSYLSHRPPVLPDSYQFVQQQPVGNSIEHFVEVQVNNIHCSPCVNRRCSVVEGNQVSWRDLPLVNPCWLFPITCFIWFVTPSCFLSKLKAFRLQF